MVPVAANPRVLVADASSPHEEGGVVRDRCDVIDGPLEFVVGDFEPITIGIAVGNVLVDVVSNSLSIRSKPVDELRDDCPIGFVAGSEPFRPRGGG